MFLQSILLLFSVAQEKSEILIEFHIDLCDILESSVFPGHALSIYFDNIEYLIGSQISYHV